LDDGMELIWALFLSNLKLHVYMHMYPY